MTAEEIDALPEKELRELSLQKNKKGNATSDATKAQRILHQRSGGTFARHSDRRQTTSDDYAYGDPVRFTKKFK